MKFITISPPKALKPFLKQKPLRSDIDRFKVNLIKLLDQIGYFGQTVPLISVETVPL